MWKFSFWRSARPRHELRIMDSSGDTLVADWDPAIASEVDAALAGFRDLALQGYRVFRADDGTAMTGELVKELDPEGKLYVAFKRIVGG